MPSYTIQLRERAEIAEQTMAFRFAKPPDFKFRAGQYLVLTLKDPPETDVEGNSRTFSIASAPSESDLTVATRMRDTAFKRVMKRSPIGTEVKMDAPFGSLVLHDDPDRPAVFLAGGIGITPFRSILLQAIKERLPHRLFLFYSNRRPQDAAFLEELEKMEKENPNYKFIGVVTEAERSRATWRGETGRINKEMLAHYLDGWAAPIYYVAGPPGMVTAMREMLALMGIDDSSIRAEEFDGY